VKYTSAIWQKKKVGNFAHFFYNQRNSKNGSISASIFASSKMFLTALPI